MNAKSTCRECGSITVSSAASGLCFSCQIQEQADGKDTFFFDEADTSTPFDELQRRIGAALTSIEITDELGRGGMGIVFRGTQTKLGRDVAVKVMPPMPGDDFASRFLAEARAMARLHHPHIITIHDFGQTDCRLSYIVMEYCEKGSLGDLMSREVLLPQRVLEILSDIAEALGFAHAQNVVHRDMKPENILIDRSGRAKIADFGIAKMEGDRHVARMTKTHQVLGTPMYMAPEQATSSRAVDHRADLYALGVILYEALTGEHPTVTFSPPSKATKLDRRVDDVCRSLLEPDPARRANDAAKIAQELRAIARTWRSARKLGFLSWRSSS